MINSWFVDTSVDLWSFSLTALGMCFNFFPLKLSPLKTAVKILPTPVLFKNCILSHGTRKSMIFKKLDSWTFPLSVLKGKVWGFPPSVNYCQEPFHFSFCGDISIFTWYCHGLFCGLTIYWNSKVILTTDYFAKVKYTHIYSYPLILQCSLTDVNQLTNKSIRFLRLFFFLKRQFEFCCFFKQLEWHSL